MDGSMELSWLYPTKMNSKLGSVIVFTVENSGALLFCVPVRSYRAVCCVWAPQVRAGPGTVVSIVTTGLMDPLPVQVTSEVDVEPANTAALLCVSVTRITNSNLINPLARFCLAPSWSHVRYNKYSTFQLNLWYYDMCKSCESCIKFEIWTFLRWEWTATKSKCT